MPSTTIRIERETHQKLTELGRVRGTNLLETVEAAAEALRREVFARQVSAELDELRRSPAEWSDYLAEAEVSNTADGIA